MIEYYRAGKAWSFDPLPANTDTAQLYLGMAAIAKTKGKGSSTSMDAIAGVLGALPKCIARSMRDNHTEDEVNEFIDTVVLDFGKSESLSILGDLNQLFMGIDPSAKTKDADTADA